jgi:hypothetical protein
MAGDAVADGANENGEQPCASYLGWNIRGLVAEVLEVKGGASGTRDSGEAGEPEGWEEDDDEPDFDEEDADETESEEPDDDERDA